MQFSSLYLTSLLITLSLSLPLSTPTDLPRLVLYYRTTHDSNSNPISMLPLITERNISLTHLIISSFHLNANSSIHLNDYPPSNSRFQTLWAETEVMKNAGVKVMGMIGGAAAGSFSTSTLDGDEGVFENYYAQLRDVVSVYGLQGMDLDVEQSMSQAGITRLVNRLYQDLGPDFLITLAPVASALEEDGGNLSGFDYEALEADVGNEIAFYNAQFYNGFGSMADTKSFDAVVANGWDPRKILAGQPTAPEDGTSWIPFGLLNETIISLRGEYGEIGGVMGWEYFNGEPGGREEPWEWAQLMTAILRPDKAVKLVITNETVEMLEEAWISSVGRGDVSENAMLSSPTVDYKAMINA